ncbi:MAG: hypothetical protein ACRDTE_10230 [Pseudonocardiaceae bacterium]
MGSSHTAAFRPVLGQRQQRILHGQHYDNLAVRTATGPVPLPPTLTATGPVTWVHLPDCHALGSCREIDIYGALHTLAQRQPGPCRR